MAQGSNGWFLGLTVGLFLIMVVSIGFLMYSLAKRGDERKKLIKMKAMSGTFLAAVAVLVIQIILSLIRNRQLEGMNPLINLTILSVVFFFLLLYYRKHYGD